MKISIVTPSFNQCRFLRLTIESVLSQRGPFEIELLVMDGGSTDGSVELLRSISDPRLKWVSEKDAGQADALAKGLARVTGDVIGWINSDDEYTPGAFEKAVGGFDKHPDKQWLIGRCVIINENGGETRRWITAYKNALLRRYSFERLLHQDFICQPSVFWRRGFGERVGMPDVTLQYTMDYDLFLRMARASDPLVIDDVLSRFRIHGTSKSGTTIRKRFDEHDMVVRRHAPPSKRGLLLVARFHTVKTVLAYRLMWMMGMLGKG